MPLGTVSTIGLGATIGYSTTTPPVTYTIFALAKSIEPVGVDVGTVDTTILSSTWKTFLPTIPDGGEVSFGVNYASGDAGAIEVQGAFATPVVLHFQVVLKDTGKITFDAIVTGFTVTGVEPEGLVESEVTLKVTGPVVFS